MGDGLNMKRLLLAMILALPWSLASADAPTVPPPLLTDLPERVNVFEPYTHVVALKLKNGRTQLIMWGEIKSGDATRFRDAMDQVSRPISELLIIGSPGGVLEEGLQIGRIIHQNKLAVRVPSNHGGNLGKCVSACNFVFLGGLIRTIDVGGQYIVHVFHLDAANDLLNDIAVAADGTDIPSPTEQKTATSRSTLDTLGKITAPKHLANFGCDLNRIYTENFDRQVQVEEIMAETGKSEEEVDLSKDTITMPRRFAQLRALTIESLCLEQNAVQQTAEIAEYLLEMRLSMHFLGVFANIGNALPVPMTRDQLREYNITNTD
jgi:hypothetical protein